MSTDSFNTASASGSAASATAAASMPASSSSSSDTTTMAAATAAATTSSTPSQQLHQRLQQTNNRIIHLLEQMSWQENRRSATSDAPSSATALVSSSSSSSSSSRTAAALLKPATTTAAASPTTSSSIFTQCRPFDRAYYLRYVSTYTPLVWSAKDSPLLSPLVCARYGWVAASSPLARDHIHCTLCRAQLHILFSPSLQFTPESYAVLAAKYHTLLIKGHQVDCPWADNPYDENFALLYPTGPANTHTPHATRVWIALNQVKSRAQTFDDRASRAQLGRLNFSNSFREELQTVLRKQPHVTATAMPSLEQIPVATLLAICGWEKRSRFGLGEETNEHPDADASSTPLVFQCGFGCREVHQVSEYIRPVEADATSVSHNLEQSSTEEQQAEEEERSDFQSPLKKRKLPDASVAVEPTSFPSSSPPTSSPTLLHFIAEGGFDPLRSHRMFCPFIREFSVPTDEAETSNAAAATTTNEPNRTLTTDDMKGQPGWAHLFAWWLQRQQQKHRPSSTNEDSTTATASSSGREADFSPPPPAGLTAMHSVLHPHIDPSSLVLHERERTYQGIVDNVRKLLQPPTNNKAALTRALALLDTNARASQSSIKLAAATSSSPTKKRYASEL